jgi:hypothetical protein
MNIPETLLKQFFEQVYPGADTSRPGWVRKQGDTPEAFERKLNAWMAPHWKDLNRREQERHRQEKHRQEMSARRLKNLRRKYGPHITEEILPKGKETTMVTTTSNQE